MSAARQSSRPRKASARARAAAADAVDESDTDSGSDSEPDDEVDALDNGWLALDTPVGPYREVFYQSRSTRVDLHRYQPRYREHTYDGKKLGLKVIDASEMVKLLSLPSIYKQYMKRKKFGADYDPFGHYHERDQFMVFYLETADNIVGFTKQKRYRYQEEMYSTIDTYDSKDLAGLESCIHANIIPISDITLDMELQWARDNHVGYFYMGSGYEMSSEYKSRYKGFQWWTGTEWSTNKKLYKRLCRRDSKLTDFSALGNLSLIPDKT